MAEYYIMYNGQQVGPMSMEQLVCYGLNPNSQIWREGVPDWAPAYTQPELMELISKSRPQQPECHPVPASGKDKLVAGLLAIFIGSLGIQYFYLGRTTAGIITILLSFVTCGLWSLVMFIQGIYMLVIDQPTFDQKYVYTDSTYPLF